MKLINKEEYTVQNIDEAKLSAYDFKTDSILDHEGEVPDAEFIKKLKKVGKLGKFDKVEIVEKSDEDKEKVREKNAKDEKIRGFNGFSFIAIVRDDFVKSGGKYEKFNVNLSAELKEFKEIERNEEVEVDGELVEKIVPYKKVWLQKLNIEDRFDLVDGVVTTSLDLEIQQNPAYEFEISDAYLKTRVIIKKEEL